MIDTSSRVEKGLAVRRKVLGDEYVDRAMKNGWDFAQQFQTFITEFCWDGVWNRQIGRAHV